MEDDKVPGKGEDFFVQIGETDGGQQVVVHHQADHSLKLGVLHPMREGMPIPDDAVLVRRREGTNVWDSEGDVASLRKGPSKAVTRAYRNGYDKVFGPKDSN